MTPKCSWHISRKVTFHNKDKIIEIKVVVGEKTSSVSSVGYSFLNFLFILAIIKRKLHRGAVGLHSCGLLRTWNSISRIQKATLHRDTNTDEYQEVIVFVIGPLLSVAKHDMTGYWGWLEREVFCFHFFRFCFCSFFVSSFLSFLSFWHFFLFPEKRNNRSGRIWRLGRLCPSLFLFKSLYTTGELNFWSASLPCFHPSRGGPR